MMKTVAFGLAALSSISAVAADGLGIAYGAVLNDGSTCKSQDQVNADFATMLADDSYATIRQYGTNCLDVVFSAVMANNMKIFIGLSNDLSTTAQETQTVISTVNGNWGFVDTVAVGNEGFIQNPPSYTAADLGNAIGQTRSTLQGAGFSGPVTTVDQFYIFLNNHDYCTLGDYVAINVYAFFDTNGQDVSNAASFVQTQQANVVSACSGARVVVTESGWPSAGDSMGASVPSPANQAEAISLLKGAYADGLYLFEAFNEYWKPAGDLNVENYWGFLGNSNGDPAPSKRSISRVRRSKNL